MTLRIGVTGGLGRMGRAILASIQADPAVILGAVIQRQGHDVVGKRVQDVLPDLKTEVIFSDDLAGALPSLDAVIDFSTPDALKQFAPIFAAHKRCAWVIGTTGLTPEDKACLMEAAADVPLVQSGNMSLGVNILTALVEQTAKRLGEDFDIEVLEMHHRHKVDAPSGTALMLGQAAADGRGVALDAVKETVRDGITGARQAGKIGFATLRGGSVVGEHSVIFAGDQERLVLSHSATDRRIFANGAVHAAKWLSGKPAGFYTMRDVLDLNG